MNKKMGNMRFYGAPFGVGFRAVLARALEGSWGVFSCCMFHSKRLSNFFLFGAADAADPHKRSELAAERPTSASAASCGREAATQTSAAIRNVLSTVYAPSGAERAADPRERAGREAPRTLHFARRSAPRAPHPRGLAILFRPQGRGLLILESAGYLN